MLDIDDTMLRINQSNEYYCQKYQEDDNTEGWYALKPANIFGKQDNIEINIIFHYEENTIQFIMPFYGSGSEGLVGERIAEFDSMILHLNSQINGGHITKFTYDETHAIVFMSYLPLSRMDYIWFSNTLDFLVDCFTAYRPILDRAIYDLQLSFDEKAGLLSSGTKYLQQQANHYQRLLGQ